jgi:peptidoglycan/xylan/chitin deacetylase (PgdA/CDA1 family)
MNRRHFVKLVGLSGIASCLDSSRLISAPKKPQLAITMDDFDWSANSVRLSGSERNEAVLSALRSHSVKAALFVRGSNIDSEQGKQLLRAWDTAGHLIGNHSYSHMYYHSAKVSPESFAADILRCEELLKAFPGFRRYFRFPYLKEGDTVAKRDSIRTFLAKHEYRTGHVTIDASDWYIEDRLRKRLAREPGADLNPYRAFYLDHLWDRALFYDDLARKVLGHPVKHTILVHFNLLNSLFLGDVIEMFKSKGWEMIDADNAFKDPVFSAQPKIVPAGESLIWALAKETGRFDSVLRYPGEGSEYEAAKMDRLGL